MSLLLLAFSRTVALGRRPDANRVELMSAGTFDRLYGRGII